MHIYKINSLLLKNCFFYRWAVIKDFLDIFNNMSAAYLLTEGSLINFYRNFSCGKDDVDFAIELKWWMEADNKKQMATMLEEKGIWKYDTFGEFGQTGYEEKWQRDGIKVDLFSSYRGKNNHSIAMWVNRVPMRCTFPMWGAEMFSWWEGRKVRIPLPTRKVVETMAGPNWRIPMNQWRWDLDPFLTGYCRY